ncbi:DUF6193 family natural product biosynthesis protein [Streptomyces sp. NPDC056796]|uniref:DUF6193 family natural product biosynthesis protein n=1 Tax=Streptomyces sp. NPDC056796 TaxID=3345947 RepID=UPI00368D635B
MLQAAYAEPRIRELFPEVSHPALCASVVAPVTHGPRMQARHSVARAVASWSADSPTAPF